MDIKTHEEISTGNIFVKPGLANIADHVLLFLDVQSLITCRSVCHSWNDNIRGFIVRHFLRLEDLVILPAMEHEYKKQHMGGTLDYWEEDELEQMASNLVCYHVRGFKKGEAERIVSSRFRVLPQWRNKNEMELSRSKEKKKLSTAINTALREAVLKDLLPGAPYLHKKNRKFYKKIQQQSWLYVKV